MIFLHGTVTMHQTGTEVSREERIAQVVRKDPKVVDFSTYVPICEAVVKLQHWANQGARIVYLSSRRDPIELGYDQQVLENYNFPRGEIYYRKGKESYANVVKRVMPDILIEDDCESIGKDEIAYPHLSPEVKAKIKSIIVPEFGGIDHLPDSIKDLTTIH